MGCSGWVLVGFQLIYPPACIFPDTKQYLGKYVISYVCGLSKQRCDLERETVVGRTTAQKYI